MRFFSPTSSAGDLRASRCSSRARRWSSRTRASRLPSIALWSRCRRFDLDLHNSDRRCEAPKGGAMTENTAELPAGFVRFNCGNVRVVCADYVADATRKALESGTLYDYAKHHPTMRALSGRHAVYAATL